MCVCVGARVRVRTHASIRAYSVLAPAFTLLLVSQFLYGLQSKAKKQTNQQQQHTHTKKVGGGGGSKVRVCDHVWTQAVFHSLPGPFSPGLQAGPGAKRPLYSNLVPLPRQFTCQAGTVRRAPVDWGS